MMASLSPPSEDQSGPGLRRLRLVVGDDGSVAADVVWLWGNNHS